VLCALVGYLSGMRPIQEISRTAARIRSTTLDERIQAHGLPAELAGLAETFNSMLDRLEQSFLHISHFSDDVAHELRTPVNNLRGEIEVALSKARSGETKVEEFYGAAAMDAGVVLRVCDDGAGQCAEVNRTLFQQAIGNLVSNAIAHTRPGGTVTIRARADASQLTVSVSDTGCGIPPEHLPRVFRSLLPDRSGPRKLGAERRAGSGRGQNHRNPARWPCRHRQRSRAWDGG
jgi:two-component system, OmpR family, heavy metal sensor histidine kinase CusS